MKYLIFLLSILLLNANNAMCCKCNLRYIAEELELCNEIIVGQIVNNENNKYEIRILKEWCKKTTSRKKNFTYIKQQNSSCTKRAFELNKTYLFYIQNGEVHNCSRTIEFINTQDVEHLDQDSSLQAIYYNFDAEYDKINYNRKYVITDAVGNNNDVKDKSVIYVFKNKLISKSEIPENRNRFYPIRYYKMNEQVKFEQIDFIFFVDNSHQDRIRQPKLSKKIMRKIKKARR